MRHVPSAVTVRSSFPRARQGVVVAMLLAAVSAGCSAGVERRGSAGLNSVPAEPELVAAVSARRPIGRPIPEVIRRPRPYRASAAAPAAAARPLVRPVAAEEPAREPARLAATGAADAGVRAVPAEVRGMLGDYLRAFNRHDAAALAAHWSANGENVNLDTGEVTAGRDAVAGVFAALFAEDAAATIDIDVDAIRPLSRDVAVVDGTSAISFADGQAAGSRFAAVVMRRDGRWLLESVRESGRPAADGQAGPLDELAWLVGSWEDVGAGVTAGSRCGWASGRGFLVRNHVVAADAGPEPRGGEDVAAPPGLLPAEAVVAREVTEIIGWDPERECIRSWLFTSQGRFAEGVWRRSGEAWTIHVTGLGADAGRDAECVLERSGPDDITVRRTGDAALADLLPPACGFVRSAR